MRIFPSDGLILAQIRDVLKQQRQPTSAMSKQDAIDEIGRLISVWGSRARSKNDSDSVELARAAACYAVGSQNLTVGLGASIWPPGWTFNSCCSQRDSLVRAAALLLAEIDRIDRAKLADAAFKGER